MAGQQPLVVDPGELTAADDAPATPGAAPKLAAVKPSVKPLIMDAKDLTPVAPAGGGTKPEVTTLTPAEEAKFQSWGKANKITDLDHPDSHYDYRGYWKDKGDKPVKFGVDHFPDTYKQHGHPTFSVESKYSAGASDGGHWEGDKYVPGQAAVAPGAKPPPGKKAFNDTSYANKPASLKARGGELFESIPFITGATGGMLGGAAGAPGGPVGVGTGGVAGAGAGGLLGRYTQHLLQQMVGGTKVGDFMGVPALPPPSDKTHPIIAELGKAATEQMEIEMGGAIIAAPLGFIRRGGFAAVRPGALGFKSANVATNVAEDAARGTRLSIPEKLDSATGKTLQSYAAGAFKGGTMQKAVREQGSAGAVADLNAAVAVLHRFPDVTKAEGGRAAVAGLAMAKEGQNVVGKQLQEAAEKAGPVDMTKIKAEAINELQQKIVPLLSAFPDIAGKSSGGRILNEQTMTAVELAQAKMHGRSAQPAELATLGGLPALIRSIRNDPTLIQRLPRPTVTRLLDTILEKTNSPTVKMLREVLGAEDQSAFKGVWEKSKLLRKASTAEDTLYAKNDVQRLSTRFSGLFREAMGKASPEFDAISAQYRIGARVLESKAVKTILKTAVDKPEAVVALFKNNPTAAGQLQRALKATAARGPFKDHAAAAFDTIRAAYLHHEVIQGGKSLPRNEEGFNAMLTSMAGRLNDAKQSGVIKQWFSDARGKQVIANMDAVANLMEKRTAPMAGNLRKIFEIGRLITGGIGVGKAMLTGSAPTTGTVAAGILWEAAPDFYIWMIHDPAATRWFMQGVAAPNPTVSSAATIRLMELYRQSVVAGRQGQSSRPAAASQPPSSGSATQSGAAAPPAAPAPVGAANTQQP